MNSISANQNDQNLTTIYGAIVDYHNNLVQIRFVIAGLCLAATGFLMSSWFSIDDPNPIIIPTLGFVLAVICLLLEIRTNHLLKNLGARGLEIEKKMNADLNLGFFSLMHKQPIPWGPFKKTISHTLLILLLYMLFIICWIFLFFFL